MNACQTVVNCRQLCKKFGRFSDRYVLHEVTFEVRSGALLAIIGANGAGKTTLLQLLMGFLFPLRGSIELFGSSRIETQRHRLGYLPEKLPYPPGITVIEYLELMGRLCGLAIPEAEKAVGLALEQFELLDMRRLKLSQCSAGMLKKVGLAATLLGEPELVLLDEPADNLDPAAQIELAGLFRRLKNAGKTLMISTHHLESLRQYGDDILLLDEGQVVYQGSPEVLWGEPSGFLFQFEESDMTLMGALYESALPMEKLPDGLLLKTLEPQARRELLEHASKLGLTLKSCEPCHPSPQSGYQRLVDEFRAGKAR